MILKTIVYTVFTMYFSTNVSAQKLDEYQVEILLFKQKNISTNESETFEKTILIPNHSESLSLPVFEPPETDKSELPLSNINPQKIVYDEITEIHPGIGSLIQLNDAKRSINRSSYYKMLTHTAWRQLGLDNAKAKKIRITQGDAFVVLKNTLDKDVANIAVDYKYLLKQWENYKKEHNIVEAKSYKNASLFENDNAFLDEPTIAEGLKNYLQSINLVAHIAYPLDGTIKVVRTRYLHMHTDLLWTVVLPKNIEIPNDDSLLEENDFNLDIENLKDKLKETPDSFIEPLEKLNLQSYSFKSHRKMRSKKQHYIDHPKLGLVTIIMPVLNKEE